MDDTAWLGEEAVHPQANIETRMRDFKDERTMLSKKFLLYMAVK